MLITLLKTKTLRVLIEVVILIILKQASTIMACPIITLVVFKVFRLPTVSHLVILFFSSIAILSRFLKKSSVDFDETFRYQPLKKCV